ncbi:MAG TPA: SDR family NAD(P)-dependent oxidoreductase [Pedobacter sp.]|nr:SDR family NAD(P)-dependent oxidoreductase [Pedobacter sp.]
MKDLNSYWSENLSDKRVLIPGGTTGIGREITLMLASLGASCLICGRNQQQIDDTVNAVKQSGSKGTCTGVVADLCNAENIDNMFGQAEKDIKLS